MEPKKTHWKKAFNKDYLGSHDLDEGKDLIAVIDHVESKEVKDPKDANKKEKFNIAFFTTKIKPMILNVTNCKTIKAFAGSNYIEDWKRLPVTIYSREIKAFGEVMEALRIREIQPIVKEPELTPDNKAWPNAIIFLQKPGKTIGQVLVNWDMTQENIDKLIDEAT